MVLSFALMWWSDPFYNYFTPGFNYNAYFINLGSWVGHAPRGPESVRIAPDGTLIEPDGLTVPRAPQLSTTPG